MKCSFLEKQMLANKVGRIEELAKKLLEKTKINKLELSLLEYWEKGDRWY
jgi:hypothetical protein